MSMPIGFRFVAGLILPQAEAEKLDRQSGSDAARTHLCEPKTTKEGTSSSDSAGSCQLGASARARQSHARD